MGTSRFQDLVGFEELEDGQVTSFSLDGTPVVLVKDGERVHALGGRCPHKEAPMDQGAFCRTEKGSVLVCPWHKAVFDAVDGSLVEPLAMDALPSYPVEILEGRVLVGTEPVERQNPPARQAEETVLILGSGAAGVMAAVTLRQEGFAGAITMVTEEKELPYNRTALSKTVLLSEGEKAEAPPLRPGAFYKDNRIELIRASIGAFDPAGKVATLSDGKTLTADHVLIATGARAKPIDLPGADLGRVFTLHRAQDAEAIASVMDKSQAVTIIGSGFVGLEVASCLRQRGMGVTIIAGSNIPMEKQFGREIGVRLQQLHEENAVAFINDAKAVRIYGDGEAKGVELDDGMELPSSFVLVSVGVEPVTDFVSGLERDADGAIVVNHLMRACPGVYAAGDASAMRHEGEVCRIEHWRHAQIQGRIAALAMMGWETGEVPTPWFWTQQFGKKIEHLGWGGAYDSVQLEGDIKGFSFLATYLKGGKPVGLAGAGHAYDMARATVDFEGFVQEKL